MKKRLVSLMVVIARILSCMAISTVAADSDSMGRQDLATMMTRAYKKLSIPGWTIAEDDNYKLYYTIDKVFEDDAEISEYAKASVYFMVDNNVIKGISETKFGPRNTTSRQDAENYANATREQSLIMAVRCFKNLGK